MENQTYSWRWRLAQFLELRWWQRYLGKQDWKDYLAAKKQHWHKMLNLLEISPKPAERILDAGCGPAGIFTILEGQKVDAIDPLLAAYAHKLKGFQATNFPNVHFEAIMLEQMTAKETYDYVFCLNAINHVENLKLALQKLAQGLKPQGTLVLSIDLHRFGFLKFIFRLLPGDVLHPQQDGLEDYLSILKELGLNVQKELVLKPGWIFNYVLIKAQKGMAPHA